MSDIFQPEQVIGGRYRVLGKLGGGGMADVHLCEDLTLGRRVALKVLLSRFHGDQQFVERFRREAKAAAALNDPSLVSVYDWGEVDGTYYIVMEYVEGETLKDFIRRRGRLSGNEAVDISLQLLHAVAYAHRNGVVHRDIKPQNVMLDRDGRVKVMDFGIARAGDSGMTEAGSVLGTAQYLAPEQAKGQRVDERSDLYSVGIVLYEMLTGTVPFRGDSAVTVALKHVNESPPEPAELVPGMPYALNQIVLKAIAKDPDLRYQTGEQFAADLRAARSGGPLAAAAYDPGAERTRLMTTSAGDTRVMAPAAAAVPAGARRKRSRGPLIAVIVLLAVIAAAAFGLWYVIAGGQTEVPSVVGMSKNVAVKAITDAGFEVGLKTEYSDTVPEGVVSRQEPPGGTKLRDGGTVDIWVSKGSSEVTLRDLRGFTAQAAADWLEANDLVGVRKTGKSADYAKGEVYRQDPPAGIVQRGSTVTYWVSTGKPQSVVPDVTNMSQAAAELALAEAGLVLGIVTSEPSDTVEAGLVIRQDPAADTKVAEGSRVNVVLSLGPATPSPSPTATSATVPNVYGMDSTTAADKLEAAGFLVVIKEKGGTGQDPGTVVGMNPDAGKVVAYGSTVTITVAK